MPKLAKGKAKKEMKGGNPAVELINEITQLIDKKKWDAIDKTQLVNKMRELVSELDRMPHKLVAQTTIELDAETNVIEEAEKSVEEAEKSVKEAEQELAKANELFERARKLFSDDTLDNQDKKGQLESIKDEISNNINTAQLAIDFIELLISNTKDPAVKDKLQDLLTRCNTAVAQIKQISEKINNIDLTTSLTGGKLKKSSKSKKQKQKGGELMDTGAIYNVSGLITDANNPLAIGDFSHLANVNSPFSAGMDTSLFATTNSVPPVIMNKITPPMSGGKAKAAKSKKSEKAKKRKD